MKKIYTFITAAFLAATVSVSAQKVSLRVDNNYEVKIDGRNYGNNAVIPGLSDGRHQVQLYSVEKSFLGLGKRRTLVSTDRFDLRNNDVNINVDQYGKLSIRQAGDFNRRNGDNRTRDDNEYNGNKDNGYGRDNNPGRGNKYGHYKNKKSKKSKDRNDDSNDHRNHDRNDHGIHN
ncbi:MAG: hypothetical protein SGI96_05700 [Bacteroidota bacterium]|nr:hypothetical protein [Bacteroidota bacterium]